MNMKKTLAGLMAGVVAISAMATVAVSAKAQKADSITWSTMAEETKNAESVVYVKLTKDEWKENLVLLFKDKTDATAVITVKSVEKITVAGNDGTYVIDSDLARLFDSLEDGDKTLAGNALELLTGTPADADTFEVAVKVTSSKAIIKNAIAVTSEAADGNGGTTVTPYKSTNVKKDASKEKVGADLNPVNAGIEIVDLNDQIEIRMNKVGKLEVPQEIADFLKDAKGATLEFTFAKKDLGEEDNGVYFEDYEKRYDWASGNMEAALSLRINNSKVLSVDMAEFDKANFTAIYNWDEVMAKFQVGSVTGLVNSMQFKVNNDKLPKDKDGNIINLELKSITAKIPEVAETEDDTMVEDFAAGESATVVEDTLPAATDAPAADAPAADAPATTDAAANPETGNSAVALLAIPAALAAAAIVAKKRG